jgi:hypothetical protein
MSSSSSDYEDSSDSGNGRFQRSFRVVSERAQRASKQIQEKRSSNIYGVESLAHYGVSSKPSKANGRSSPASNHDAEFCKVCKSTRVTIGNTIVFCDACDLGVHQACEGPPVMYYLPRPYAIWYCQQCLSGKSIKNSKRIEKLCKSPEIPWSMSLVDSYQALTWADEGSPPPEAYLKWASEKLALDPNFYVLFSSLQNFHHVYDLPEYSFEDLNKMIATPWFVLSDLTDLVKALLTAMGRKVPTTPNGYSLWPRVLSEMTPDSLAFADAVKLSLKLRKEARDLVRSHKPRLLKLRAAERKAMLERKGALISEDDEKTLEEQDDVSSSPADATSMSDLSSKPISDDRDVIEVDDEEDEEFDDSEELEYFMEPLPVRVLLLLSLFDEAMVSVDMNNAEMRAFVHVPFLKNDVFVQPDDASGDKEKVGSKRRMSGATAIDRLERLRSLESKMIVSEKPIFSSFTPELSDLPSRAPAPEILTPLQSEGLRRFPFTGDIKRHFGKRGADYFLPIEQVQMTLLKRPQTSDVSSQPNLTPATVQSSSSSSSTQLSSSKPYVICHSTDDDKLLADLEKMPKSDKVTIALPLALTKLKQLPPPAPPPSPPIEVFDSDDLTLNEATTGESSEKKEATSISPDMIDLSDSPPTAAVDSASATVKDSEERKSSAEFDDYGPDGPTLESLEEKIKDARDDRRYTMYFFMDESFSVRIAKSRHNLSFESFPKNQAVRDWLVEEARKQTVGEIRGRAFDAAERLIKKTTFVQIKPVTTSKESQKAPKISPETQAAAAAFAASGQAHPNQRKQTTLDSIFSSKPKVSSTSPSLKDAAAAAMKDLKAMKSTPAPVKAESNEVVETQSSAVSSKSSPPPVKIAKDDAVEMHSSNVSSVHVSPIASESSKSELPLEEKPVPWTSNTLSTTNESLADLVYGTVIKTTNEESFEVLAHDINSVKEIAANLELSLSPWDRHASLRLQQNFIPKVKTVRPKKVPKKKVLSDFASDLYYGATAVSTDLGPRIRKKSSRGHESLQSEMLLEEIDLRPSRSSRSSNVIEDDSNE